MAVDSTATDDDIVLIQVSRELYKLISYAEIGGNVLTNVFWISVRFDTIQCWLFPCHSGDV
jgi:hypothetical protein